LPEAWHPNSRSCSRNRAAPTVKECTSFLQALNPDQAALFDCLYRTNVVPVPFFELWADLANEGLVGPLPEQVIAEAARLVRADGAPPT
jgi:hypothetical protein